MRDRTFFRETPAYLQAIDATGIILDVSDRWLQWLGYTGRTCVIGKSFDHFLSAESRVHVRTRLIPRLLDRGEGHELEVEYIDAQGTIRTVLASVTVVRQENNEIDFFLLVLIDVSERKQAERVLLLISEATVRMVGNDFFRSLASHLARALDVRYALITECANRSLTRLRTLAYVDRHDFFENFEYDLAGTPCEKVIAGAVCYYPNQLGSLFKMTLNEEAYLGMPMHNSQGEVVGHLAVLDDKPMQRSEREIAVLQILAERAGAEVERQQSEIDLQQSRQQLRQLNEQLKDYTVHLEEEVTIRTQELQRRRRVAESLRDMVVILNSNRPRCEVLDYVVDSSTKLLGASGGAVYTLQSDGQSLIPENTLDIASVMSERLPVGIENGFWHQVMVRCQPTVVTNLPTVMKGQVHAHFQTMLAVPMLGSAINGDASEAFGGIALYYCEPRTFTDEEIGTAVTIAAQAALALENHQLRRKVEQAAVTEERNRLARELHDSVTQQLYSLTLLSEGWRRMAKTGTFDQVEAALGELNEISRQALSEMRLLVHELRPPKLEKEGLWGAIHQRLNAVEQRAGIETRLITNQMIDLPSKVEEGLYRITQEALNNMLKHAAATQVTIRIDVHTHALSLQITDNGKGIDLNQPAQLGGIGLASMRERAETLHGEFAIESAPGQGTSIRVYVPLPTS